MNDGTKAAARYVGILRAPTRVAVPRSITLQNIPRGRARFEVVFWTEFRDEGFSRLRIVRELLARVTGPASSMQDAAGEFTILANQYAPVLATAANIVSGDMRLWLCFEQPSDGDDFAGKQFLQSYDAGPQGLPTGSRWLDEDVGLACLRCFMKRGPHEQRLQRAVRQYQQALLHWAPGRETLSVSHLWMAIEALTKVIERQQSVGGLTSAQLADKLGVEKKKLDGELRRRFVFAGDADTYRQAKAASDGFEHSFMDLEKLARLSVAVRDRTAACVRRTILELGGVDGPVLVKALAPPYDRPLGWLNHGMTIQGRFTSADANPSFQEPPVRDWKAAAAESPSGNLQIKTSTVMRWSCTLQRVIPWLDPASPRG